MEVPCAVTDIGGLSEAVVPGETGYLVTPGSSDDMHRVLANATSNAGDLKNLGKNARQKVVEKFSVAMMVDRTADVLTLVAGPN